ncbi:protein translocase subunit SecF [Actinoplanes sp. NPDC051859]|uniref:protein translocase subunit SecF n=1 Tax=Actinoplanes sp. NPDC051859 TaxID=3363909 RepID=UPI0037A7D46F
MAKGFAERLYMGEANLNIVGRRKMWFAIAGALILIAVGSFFIKGFHQGIEFSGGTQFVLPASVGSAEGARSAVERAVETAGIDEANVHTAQEVGGGGTTTYNVRTAEMDQAEATKVKEALVADLKVAPTDISDDRVSEAWGSQVTEQAILGLVIFLVLVLAYLVIRFEWRMAVAAVSSLILDLLLTAGVYSLVGFEVTPSTVIGFLTILGFSLYDVVVVFDKVQENTRGITAGSSRTYSEAANLAVNQTLMRSINTGLVALLPVGGLLFIGAGLLDAGTLKDLGLVLFVGMGLGVLSSIVFAAPVLATLKDMDPKIKAHNARVLARRSSRSSDVARGERTRTAGSAESDDVPALAGSNPGATPRPGARPVAKRTTNRGGGAGNRPSGGQKRR